MIQAALIALEPALPEFKKNKTMKPNPRNFIRGSAIAAGGLLIPSAYWTCKREKDPGIYDLVIYGRTSSGIIAAVQAARMGLSVIMVEPTGHLGGLTTGGPGRNKAV